MSFRSMYFAASSRVEATVLQIGPNIPIRFWLKLLYNPKSKTIGVIKVNKIILTTRENKSLK